jgi:hypothetical protein
MANSPILPSTGNAPCLHGLDRCILFIEKLIDHPILLICFQKEH